VRFVKTHDAYTLTAAGEPLLAGPRGAEGAVAIVRDPRDVAPSLAHHSRIRVDQAIAMMNNERAAFCARSDRQYHQLRQQLPSWSGYVASWLDQTDIPVLLVRYEDMQADAAGQLRRVLEFTQHPADEEAIARAAAFADFAQLRGQEREKGFREAPRPHKGGDFFRRGEAGAWLDELTAEQVARIEAVHAPMMQRLGYALSETRPLAQSA
ncbi:MAG TPA: sulfotransferase domain-containing protein, partial [Pseudolabrys sp.]|nr:sulfotransferase domain-containing protein [Pseudolabrys sp.]